MKSNIFILLSFFLLLTGCDVFKKSTDSLKTEQNVTTPVESTAPVATTEAAKPVEVTCSNGQAPQILRGACDGVWKVARANGAITCNFAWGPKVECPAGTASLENVAACYGVTAKPVTASDKIATEADCLAKFGKMPAAIDYTLKCCPK